MSSPFVAEIRILPYSFAPTGWATCDGQLLPISQNTALFSLLGTMYGGDGKSTFALPDLAGNAPMHMGQGQGLSDRFEGESGGEEFVTLLQSEMAVHNHTLNDSTKPAAEAQPAGQLFARGAGVGMYDTNAQPTGNLDFNAVGLTGGGLPHNNTQPYITLQYCIAMQGIFPARP
ncbi:MAG TPA: tail fiber protein [Thermoleophilaceae bacterium]|nr:tail fiber protein [Thermoleophilaceae bacterium]